MAVPVFPFRPGTEYGIPYRNVPFFAFLDEPDIILMRGRNVYLF